jgi:hypothetical protein
MEEEAIPSFSTLRIAVFNRGSGLDRTALEACPAQYPQVEVLDEVAVHRALRAAGMTPDALLALGDRFAAYGPFRDFQLLLIAFRAGGRDHLRIVNFPGRYVTTVLLDVPRPTCNQILAGQRLVSLDSIPPLADLKVDERPVGQAPLWLWLRDGDYRVECAEVGHTFKPVPLKVPAQTRLVCQREEMVSAPGGAMEPEPMTGEEKAGSVLVTILGIAATAAAVILPILFLF